MRQQSGELGVALVGSGFIGTAHSQGWRTATRVFDLPLKVMTRVLCDRNRVAADTAAARLGWAEAESSVKAG
jgi:predicted dehydrogenase